MRMSTKYCGHATGVAITLAVTTRPNARRSPSGKPAMLAELEPGAVVRPILSESLPALALEFVVVCWHHVFPGQRLAGNADVAVRAMPARRPRSVLLFEQLRYRSPSVSL
jgi:hypothetical protein